jgi:hypothetical protein
MLPRSDEYALPGRLVNEAVYFLTAEPWKADDQIKAIEAKLRRLMVRATYNRKDKKSLLKLAASLTEKLLLFFCPPRRRVLPQTGSKWPMR